MVALLLLLLARLLLLAGLLLLILLTLLILALAALTTLLSLILLVTHWNLLLLGLAKVNARRGCEVPAGKRFAQRSWGFPPQFGQRARIRKAPARRLCALPNPSAHSTWRRSSTAALSAFAMDGKCCLTVLKYQQTTERLP